MAAATFMVVIGCATVSPHADYQHTLEQIRERTAIDDIYDPESEELVEAKVAAILENGLTADEAASIALLNHRRFWSLFDGLGASRAEVVQSGLLSNPNLSLSIRFPEGGGRSKLTAGFAQQIVDLWQIPIRKKIAETELERAVLGVMEYALTLCATVRVDYFQLAELIRAEELANENLALVQKVVDLANARFQSGEVGQADVNISRGDLLTAQIDLMTIARDRKLSQIALARDLGLSQQDVEISLVEDALIPPAMEFPSGPLIELAMTRRVDIQAAAATIRGAEEEIVRQHRSVFPSVSVGVEAERPARRALPGRNVLADTARSSVAAGKLTAPSIQSRAERNQERSQIIDLLLGPTLDVTLPVFDQNQAQIAKAKFIAHQRRNEFKDMLDTVAREVNDAIVKRDAAAKLVEFYQSQSVPHARLTVESARAAYSAGEETVLVLLQTQQSLNSQQRAQITATRDLAQATVELEHVIGGRVQVEEETDSSNENEIANKAGVPDEMR